MLIDHKSPLLSVETIGPRKIVVGKEAAYEVLLQNSGEQAAEEVAVTVGLPDWADVAAASASTGEVRRGGADHSDPCRWMLGRIEAHSKEKLALKIIPRQSKPFELAVHWDFKQAPSQAMIEVQEPKLTMRLDGPREVLFGKREIYQLKLGNSGNGPAENVMLTLMPLNAGDAHPVTHRLGTITAGDQRTIEIELTARQSGNLTIRVEANGDGGAHVDLAEHVLVHRGALQVDVEGPAVQFVGTPAGFKCRVRNPGDATARNVKVTAKLPTGTKFVSGSDGAVLGNLRRGRQGAHGRRPLGAGRAAHFGNEVHAGPVRARTAWRFARVADDDLVAAAEAITRVEAMADLRLEVKEPEGPVPVGGEARTNCTFATAAPRRPKTWRCWRTSPTASSRSSPRAIAHHISPGQVVFDSIPAIAPATEVVLTVKAKADVAGNHVFRAEVHCKSTGTRLVREETTHYYRDSPSPASRAATPTRSGLVTRRPARPPPGRRPPLPCRTCPRVNRC